MKFYEWSQTPEIMTGSTLVPNWQVDEPHLHDEINWWDLKRGRYLDNWDPNTEATFSEDTDPTDFPFVELLIPICSPRLRELLKQLGVKEVQFLPIRLVGKASRKELTGYSIMNYLSVIDCLDREKSNYRIWTKENLLFWEKRPWMLGTFEYVQNPVLQSQKIGDALLFRMWGWDMVIVREDIKRAIEKAGIIGCRFTAIETV
jgi:hypothetical protein